jgi:cytidylate kinase
LVLPAFLTRSITSHIIVRSPDGSGRWAISKGLGEDDGFHSGRVRDIIESRGMRIDEYKQLSKEGMDAYS